MLDKNAKHDLIEQAKKKAVEGTAQFKEWLLGLSKEEQEFLIDNAFSRMMTVVVSIPSPKNYMEN